MEILGVHFAPLNIPIRRRLQTAAAGSVLLIISFGGIIGTILSLFIAFYIKLWFPCLLYLLWMRTLDKNTPEQGGRRIEWVRNWIWWKYLREFFPIQLKKDVDFQLNAKKNYLFCSFPHGLLATGALTTFATEAMDISKIFPHHKSHLLTLEQNFKWPFNRDFLLALGLCSASAKSINYLMGAPDGGNLAVLVVGGAAESFYCRPGQYQLVLKHRKGFAKLALRNGSPLVPVFSFGETDIYDQVDNPEGSLLRRFQEYFKKKTGVVPIVPIGRGYLQYSFGIVPNRKPINIISKYIDKNF